MKPAIETQRLYLRPWTIGDAADMYEYAKTDKVGPMAGWPPHKNIEETKSIIATFIEEDETWAIILKEEGKAIGSIGLHLRHRKGIDADFELGYVLSEDYWGCGYVPEACRAVLDYGFTEGKAQTIICSHFPFNLQSKRVIEKLGFKYLTHISESWKRYDGVVLDEEMYSLEKEDYFKSKTAK